MSEYGPETVRITMRESPYQCGTSRQHGYRLDHRPPGRGTDPKNQALSDRRGDAVRNALIQAGVSAGVPGLTIVPYFWNIQNVNERTTVAALAALAQETRLRIFRMLVEAGPEGLAAGRIATALRTPPATLSFHLAQLSHAGLVAARRDGRSIRYSADFAAARRLVEFLTDKCCARSSEGCDLGGSASRRGRDRRRMSRDKGRAA